MKKSLSLAFCLVAYLYVFSQGKQSIDFSGEKSRTRKQLFKIPVAVKASALEAAFGGQSLFLELGLSEIFSIEGGVGVDFAPLVDANRNFYTKYSNGLGGGFSGFGNSSGDYDNTGIVPFEKMNRELGYHGSFSLKLMPSSEDDLTGGYYALNFRYSKSLFKNKRLTD